MLKRSDFNRDVALPSGLTLAAISKSIEYVERPFKRLASLAAYSRSDIVLKSGKPTPPQRIRMTLPDSF